MEPGLVSLLMRRFDFDLGDSVLLAAFGHIEHVRCVLVGESLMNLPASGAGGLIGWRHGDRF